MSQKISRLGFIGTKTGVRPDPPRFYLALICSGDIANKKKSLYLLKHIAPPCFYPLSLYTLIHYTFMTFNIIVFEFEG